MSVFHIDFHLIISQLHSFSCTNNVKYCTLGARRAHYRVVLVPLPVRYLHVCRDFEFTPPGLQLLSLCCATAVLPQRLRERKRFNTLIFPSAALSRLLVPPFFAPVLLFHTPSHPPSPSLFIPFVSPPPRPPAPSRHFVIVSSYTARTLRHSLTNPFIAPQTLPSFPPGSPADIISA